jgi:cell division protein ZapA
MDTVTLTIKIAGREYPMRVNKADEEQIIQAANNVNEQINQYKQKFNIQDTQDLLAMVAFDCVYERLNQPKTEQFEDIIIHQKIDYLLTLVESAAQ